MGAKNSSATAVSGSSEIMASRQCWQPCESDIAAGSAEYRLESASTTAEDDWVAAAVAAASEPESFQERLERYIQSLKLTPLALQTMSASFQIELQTGLDLHRQQAAARAAGRRGPAPALGALPLPATLTAGPASCEDDSSSPPCCSFKMLDSCCSRLPSGKEKGVFYALDFGGTNFRVVRLELDGQGGSETQQRQRALPLALLDATATATELFNFFATTVREFMESTTSDLANASQDHEIPCGFTFSYPCEQTAVDVARLICWTKGFETGRQTDDPVEGQDVCDLMNVALGRADLPLKVTCVLNDTVGTLISAAYTVPDGDRPPPLVGLIMGTGMNMAYAEPHSISAYGYKGRVINIECGNFNCDLPRIIVDYELDFRATANRNQQLLEKMTSGAYLGELARLTILRVMQHAAPPRSWESGSLDTKTVAEIIAQDDLPACARIISQAWNWEVTSDLHIRAIKRICEAVFERSAALCAAAVAAVAVKTGRLRKALGGVGVAVDGSVYKQCPRIQERMRHYLAVVLGKQQADLVDLIVAEDGSGRGAAIMAAVVAQ